VGDNVNGKPPKHIERGGTTPSMTLMAELEPDETLASINSGESFAWSEDDSLDEPVVGSWRAVLLRAAAVLAFCVLTAVSVVVVWREWPQPQPAPVSSVAPSVQAAEVEVASPAPTSVGLPPVGDAARMKPPDPDTRFLAAMDRAEVHMPTKDAAVNQGHLICRSLDQGNSVEAISARLLSLSPGVTYEQIGQVVHAAINAYCPQYEN
jgi:hypothetical protein